MTHLDSRPQDRRNFLRVLAGTVAFAGFGGTFGAAAPAASKLDHASLLNLAATAEALSVTLYHHALSGAAFRMDAEARGHLRAVLAAEQAHLTLLGTLGGAPLTRQFSLPDDLLADAGVFAETGLHLESVLIGAYIAAAHQFALLGQPELSATAAQLGASEAQHLTVLSGLAGYGPGELTLPAAPFQALSDTAPALAPFLSRGAGRVDVALPSAQAVSALAGSAAPTSPRAFAQLYRSGAPKSG